MRKLKLIILGTMMFASLPSGAFAQRGSMNPGNPDTFVNPTKGFPGFFDTNLATHGSLVVEWPPLILPFIPMPSIAVDYGVTDTLTVGTNALVSTVPWLAGGKGLSLKARTLVYGTETSQSAATVYGGYIAGGSFSSSWQMLTSNNAWKIGLKHIVSAQAIFLNFGFENGSESSIDYTNLRFSTAGIGGGYQYIVTNDVALSAHALASAATSIESDTVASNLSADLNATSGKISWGLARASIDLRSDDDWAYSVGGLYFFGISTRVSPWFSATKRW